MFKIFRVLALVFGVASFAASGMVHAAAAGYIHDLSGEVSTAVGSAAPQAAAKNAHLENNTTVTVGPKSYAVLRFADGTVAVLKENTSFQVQQYSFDPKAPDRATALFNMVRGGLRMITGLVTSKNRDALKVATPIATIGIRGTEFLAELVNPLNIVVISGQLSVTNAAGTVTVAAGQGISVPSVSALGTPVPAAKVPVNMPNVAVPPATPPAIPAAPVAGLPAGAIGGIAAGAAAAAAAAGGGGGGAPPAATTTHH